MKKFFILVCIAAASIIAMPAIAQTPVCPKAKTECYKKECRDKNCTNCTCKDCKNHPNCKDCKDCKDCPNAQCEYKGNNCPQPPCNRSNTQCNKNQTPNCKQECVKK